MVVVGARKELTPLFVGTSLLMLGIGLGCMAALPSSPPAMERVYGYFPVGPWRTAAQWTIWAAEAAVAFTLIEQLIFWIRPPKKFALKKGQSQSIEKTIDEVRARVAHLMNPKSLDVPQSLDVLLHGAMTLNASDIHLNPLSDGLKVTYRVDGVIYQVLSVPPEFSSRLSQRVKVLARLDAFTREPQDGSLRRVVGDTEIEARVSALPANHGERVVMRLVRGGEAIKPLDALGFEPTLLQRLETSLSKPQGLLFVSGPVGSGKTTTLYSALGHLHATRGETTALMTLEDPIELQLPFATQTEINPKIGLSFAQTLRSILRQDPGALMVGEIRDRETAEIATQAGLTGHLIVTTVHVQSAAGTFARLIEMDVEPFILASATIGSMAQRLVRGLCSHCRVPHAPTALERERFKALGLALSNDQFFGPSGCEACEGRGYDRRIPIAEYLLVSDAMMAAIRENKTTEEIHQLAVSEGMVPLAQHGLNVAAKGETSLSEVLRVAG